MSDPLDPQKAGVYAWEDWWGWDRNTLTLRTCRRLIEDACAAFRVPAPTVTQHKVASLSYSVPSEGTISLQAVGTKPGRGGLNAPTALHEASHHIVWMFFGDRPQDHGRTFLGVYIWLLAKAGVATETALAASARAQGLKWRPLPATLPETRRARPSGGASGRRPRYRPGGPT